jgi:hypothetical protein
MATEDFRFVVEFGYEFMPLPVYLNVYDVFDNQDMVSCTLVFDTT